MIRSPIYTNEFNQIYSYVKLQFQKIWDAVLNKLKKKHNSKIFKSHEEILY